MKEIYLINCSNKAELDQAKVLAVSLRHFDKSRPVYIAGPKELEEQYPNFITFGYESEGNYTHDYFTALIESDFDRAIYFTPWQICQYFDPAVWEPLRNLTPIVGLNIKKMYNESIIDPSVYFEDKVNIATLNTTFNNSAIYVDNTKNAKKIIGSCIDLAASYSLDEVNQVVEKLLEENKEVALLDNFPDSVWPSWVLSLYSIVYEDLFFKYDFVNNIDLSRQECANNEQWRTSKWNHFLRYHVDNDGILRIENFVQKGLVTYRDPSWLSDDNIVKLLKIDGI